jgi:hypothetical protein
MGWKEVQNTGKESCVKLADREEKRAIRMGKSI